jgi:tetratricopeptide (TPR) repeat protein
VASCLCKLSQKQEAINAFEHAARFDDYEGLALRNLARLYRDEGKTGQAALSYFRYLSNSSSQDCPSTLIFGLEDLEELKNALSQFDKVIGQNKRNTFQFHFQKCPLDLQQEILDCIDLNSESVEAILFVAQFCRECGFIDAATRYCNRLLDYGGQEATIAKALLRDMRLSLGNSSPRQESLDFSLRSVEMESSVLGSGEGISMSADDSFRVGLERLEGELLDDDNEDD